MLLIIIALIMRYIEISIKNTEFELNRRRNCECVSENNSSDYLPKYDFPNDTQFIKTIQLTNNVQPFLIDPVLERVSIKYSNNSGYSAENTFGKDFQAQCNKQHAENSNAFSYVLNNIEEFKKYLRSNIQNINIKDSKTENTHISVSNMVTTPDTDYNSNAAPKFGIGSAIEACNTSNLQCSMASLHDFTQDTSGYQWFLDYGYRDGQPQQSILSSLCESYNSIGELYYEDISKNLDANLAEVDMESFRAEDINSLLSQIQHVNKPVKNHPDIDYSLYKSELLFSPVKESQISMDSLDFESYTENGDIILTCKANKDNYTIAFEGSTLYSDESFYTDPSDPLQKYNRINKLNMDNYVSDKRQLNKSICENMLTTWSKVKNNSTQLHRYPSGNNNTSTLDSLSKDPDNNIRKSASLPNLKDIKTFKTTRKENSLMNTCISHDKLHSSKKDGSENKNRKPKDSECENISMDCESLSTTVSQCSRQNQTIVPAFNLVKMFIKQKSSSTDTCMDISSECWPLTDGSSSSVEKEKLRLQASMSSMKCKSEINKLVANDIRDVREDNSDNSFQLDSLDICENVNTTKNLTSLDKNIDCGKIAQKKTITTNPHVNNVINNNCSNISSNLKSTEMESRTSKIQLPIDMLTKSIQTSSYRKARRNLQFIPPSFLAKLNKFDGEKSAPVYVIYPNYALPDLNFVNPAQLPDIILSPFRPQSAQNKVSSVAFTNHEHEEQLLKTIKFDNIIDLKSLLTLLPVRYINRLKHIPGIDSNFITEISIKPMFCIGTALKTTESVCDCLQYILSPNNISTSGSSGQPPSSGYRGSSTILTDSEIMDSTHNDVEQMHQRLSSDKSLESKTPKSILRKRTPFTENRHKRYSMVDDKYNYSRDDINKLMKRLSLQDSYTIEEEFIDSNNQYYREMRKSRKDYDETARIRAENFLSTIPKSELKYYAEIACILESSQCPSEKYDAIKLKSEVSKALSQKKVSFTNKIYSKFSTPPNSPNISITKSKQISSLRRNKTHFPNKEISSSEQERIEKLSSNRFKRLQIQWELLSKDSSMILELASEQETKSGGSTPINSVPKSRIPRPISYPGAKTSTPTKLPTPVLKSSGHKKYQVPSTSPAFSASPTTAGTPVGQRSRTPNNRPSNKNVKSQAPRSLTRTR